MTQHLALARDIRRGILLIVGAIRKHTAADPSGASATLADVLEAAADGIRNRYMDDSR